MIVQSLHLPPLIMFLILQYWDIATLMFLIYIAIFEYFHHSVSNIYCNIGTSVKRFTLASSSKPYCRE